MNQNEKDKVKKKSSQFISCKLKKKKKCNDFFYLRTKNILHLPLGVGQLHKSILQESKYNNISQWDGRFFDVGFKFLCTDVFSIQQDISKLFFFFE